MKSSCVTLTSGSSGTALFKCLLLLLLCPMFPAFPVVFAPPLHLGVVLSSSPSSSLLFLCQRLRRVSHRGGSLRAAGSCPPSSLIELRPARMGGTIPDTAQPEAPHRIPEQCVPRAAHTTALAAKPLERAGPLFGFFFVFISSSFAFHSFLLFFSFSFFSFYRFLFPVSVCCTSRVGSLAPQAHFNPV